MNKHKIDKIDNVDIHLTDKCNLNCKHCNHFCPIVQTNEEYRDLNDIVSDFSCLAKYTELFCNLTLLGGEPFLHPKLDEILKISRQIFTDTNIKLVTNGTLYKRLPDLNQSITNNNIKVEVSVYPISNSDVIVNEFKKYIPEHLLSFILLPKEFGFSDRLLKEKDDTDLHKALICPRRSMCTQFKNKRWYICQFAAGLDDLKTAFPNQVNIKSDDCFIEINENTNKYQILSFLYKSIPDICKHCDDINTFSEEDGLWKYVTVPWETSKKELNEFYK